MSVMVVMIGVGTLAVDWGHVQLAKTQLTAAADAAARAGCASLAKSPAEAAAAAKDCAKKNIVDGTPLELKDADIQIGIWDETSHTFTQLFGGDQFHGNAVRVLAYRDASRSSAIPLSFGDIFGDDHTNLRAESIAEMVGLVNVDQQVAATANPFLAGMPAGSVASVNNPHNSPDYAGTTSDPKQSPIKVNLSLKPGEYLTFDSISGDARHDPNLADYQPDGDLSDIGHNTNGSENGIGDVTAPINALVGVFLSDDQPNLTKAPGSLNFSTYNSRNFTSLEPQIKQIFFIGDGLNDSGVQQQFKVPPGATRLFIATWDFFEWNNNSGSRTVKVNRPYQIITVK
jgi:hypothetical protein